MMRDLRAKYDFIEKTWNLWEQSIGNETCWYLTITYFPSDGPREDYSFVGATKEDCLFSTVTELDNAVRAWAYNPESSPFGRWLAIEKGWKL